MVIAKEMQRERGNGKVNRGNMADLGNLTWKYETIGINEVESN